MDLLQELPVLDPVDCDVLIHISQGVAVDRNVTVYLDDILESVFRAFDSLDDRYGAVCLVELEEIIYLKTCAGLDVIYDISCVHTINIHFLPPISAPADTV